MFRVLRGRPPVGTPPDWTQRTVMRQTRCLEHTLTRTSGSEQGIRGDKELRRDQVVDHREERNFCRLLGEGKGG